MEYREQASPISSHTYDHARTSNALPTTKYRTATYIGVTSTTFLWGVTENLTRQLQFIVMICARLVSSVE